MVFLASTMVAWEISHRPDVVSNSAELPSIEAEFSPELEVFSANHTAELGNLVEPLVVQSNVPVLMKGMKVIPENAPRIREDIPDKHLLAIETELLLNLKPGARVTLEFPQMEHPVEVLISNATTLASGNISIVGNVNGNEWLGFVLTIGEEALNGTIGTEVGVFNLRGNRNLAWLAPGRAFNHMVDPRIPDFRLSKRLSRSIGE